MSNYPEPETWQVFLRQLIDPLQERARLAHVVHARLLAPQRWAKGTFRPHEDTLRARLNNPLTEISLLFMRLLLRDFPALLRDEWPEDSCLKKRCVCIQQRRSFYEPIFPLLSIRDLPFLLTGSTSFLSIPTTVVRSIVFILVIWTVSYHRVKRIPKRSSPG